MSVISRGRKWRQLRALAPSPMTSSLDAARGAGMKRSTKATVVIASAADESRALWRSRLEDTYDLWEVAERRALERVTANVRPDILILDLTLPQLGRVRGLPHIQQLSLSTKTIVLTDAPAESEGIGTLKAGAKGYYSRDIHPALLKEAVEAVQKGEIWIERKLVASLVTEIISLTEERQIVPDAKPNPCLENLTLRQQMVAAMIGQGACNKEIASRLKISERTVKAHLTETFRSLGITDRLQLALLWMKGHSPARRDSKSA